MSPISRSLRRSAVAAVGVGVLFAAAACGSSSNSSSPGTSASGGTGASSSTASGPVTMTLWTNATTGPGMTFFKNAAKTFAAANPGVTINIQNIQNEDYDGKIQTALQAGQGSAPDILFQRGGGKMLDMIQAGQIAPITLSSDAQSGIAASTLSMDQYNGQTYAMPMDITPEGIWYSKDLFKQAGITGTPTTIAQLEADDAKLRAAGITPIGVGGKDGWPAGHWYYNFAIRDCTQDVLNAAATSGKLTDPCFLQAGKDLGAFNATNPWETDPFNTSAQGSAASSAGLLANHKVAMELQGAWEPGEVGSLTPNKKALPDLGFFPFPAVPGGKGDPSALMEGADSYSCSKWAPEPACNNFLNFLATTAQQKLYATAFQAIPANQQAQAASKSDPATTAALQAAAKAKYSVIFLDTLLGSSVGNALNSGVVNFMSGKSSDPQSILDAVTSSSSKG